jgi:hypothetical protein
MVMVVADPILEASRGPGGLDAPDQASSHQNGQGVVHRLERDGADVGPNGPGYGVGRDVGFARYRPQDGQSLGRNLNAALTKEVSLAVRHGSGVYQLLD